MTTHSLFVGYFAWVFGFIGAHRFYYGRPWTGLLWAMTGGLFLVGWAIDFFLIPDLQKSALRRYRPGEYEYTVAWLLLAFLGWLGLHRFYLGKWVTGLIFLFTGGLLGLGIVYDIFTLNDQVSEANLLDYAPHWAQRQWA